MNDFSRPEISQQIEQINIEHPEWKRKNRLSTNTDTTDHSSINDWIGDLTTTNIIVDIIWKFGKNSALSILRSFGYTDAELNIENSKPFVNITHFRCSFIDF